ncbi:two-component sensor histidine kinase [Lentzea sp. NBRC 105346]|uniref:sensor histidine kinase n=1 Tax=Lentzea sp. NBRC 105346 TaxID=3032205 RepID=UPI0024A16DCA|nr:HAMP domain-containing sensor histidine kinase [Lentzea sp. NBRC 105346]GLZ31798.1 two-component sensor histidine kinase [Lentzea sp. NBRC 105346]
MRAVVTRALLVALGLVATVFLATVVFLVVSSARDRAVSSDQRDAAVVAAVLRVTSDVDAVRATIAGTTAGASGRLAVRFADGTTVGTGHGPVLASVDGSEVLVEPAPVAVPVAWLGLLFGVILGCSAAAFLLGRRLFTPVLRALRVLADTAGRHDVRIRLTGPDELVALASAINATADRTEQLLAKEREMIADVSHRLRTPLTALRLDADAAGAGPVADRIRTAVSSLGHDVDRIIQQLQPVATSPSASSCDAAAVVEARMLFWSAHALDQGRACEVDLPLSPAPVPLSPDALGAVVDALLDNVFHYTPAHAALGVSVVRHAGWVTLAVEDAGPGIADPEAALSRGTSGGGSTGLGLDIARSAAEATGGTIHLERGQLGGARIRLRLGEANSHHAPASPRAWRLWRHHP